MRFKLLPLIGLLLLFGCGVDKTSKDYTEEWLVGVWDNTNCIDHLTLNSDKTFSWSEDKVYTGSYEVQGNQISFNYVFKLPELTQFTVAANELHLVRNNQEYTYIKVPTVVAAATTKKFNTQPTNTSNINSKNTNNNENGETSNFTCGNKPPVPPPTPPTPPVPPKKPVPPQVEPPVPPPVPPVQPPAKKEPPKQEPPKQEPPKQEPPKQQPVPPPVPPQQPVPPPLPPQQP